MFALRSTIKIVFLVIGHWECSHRFQTNRRKSKNNLSELIWFSQLDSRHTHTKIPWMRATRQVNRKRYTWFWPSDSICIPSFWPNWNFFASTRERNWFPGRLLVTHSTIVMLMMGGLCDIHQLNNKHTMIWLLLFIFLSVFFYCLLLHCAHFFGPKWKFN